VRIKMIHLILTFIMFYHLALILYSYSRCYELEYSHVDMFIICVLVYTSYVVCISYLAMYSPLSLYVICRLDYNLHVMYMLS
jgi:nucleoside recognition membrane protein YjiH